MSLPLASVWVDAVDVVGPPRTVASLIRPRESCKQGDPFITIRRSYNQTFIIIRRFAHSFFAAVAVADFNYNQD